MIKIVVGNMLDYPARYLFIGSNVRGHCENPTSNVMQVLPFMDQESRDEYNVNNETLQEYGTGHFYSCIDSAPYGQIYIGYPGTGHQESFEKMLKNGILGVSIMRFMSGPVDIVMPLIGTNVGGLDLEEWSESFNKVLTEYHDGLDPELDFITTITIVCKTQEQADYLNKTILHYPGVD